MTLTEHSDALESMDIPDAEKWLLHCQRKDFGKQILRLGMFVPCDDNSNVLEEPVDDSDRGRCEYDLLKKIEFDKKSKQYQQAKSKVLFKGWEIDKVVNGETHLSGNKYTGLVFDSNGITTANVIKTIEDTLQRDMSTTEYGMSQFNIGITNHEQ